jgi:CheY-like chemotaxis protein
MAARILIVDDEQTIADTLAVIFRSVGYEAFTAYNGLLGLEAARKLQPNVVLSDVMMPGLDGVSMAIEIRKTLPEIAVLLFSGQTGTLDLLRNAEQNGMHFELLAKPVHPSVIIGKVASALLAAGGSATRQAL